MKNSKFTKKILKDAHLLFQEDVDPNLRLFARQTILPLLLKLDKTVKKDARTLETFI